MNNKIKKNDVLECGYKSLNHIKLDYKVTNVIHLYILFWYHYYTTHIKISRAWSLQDLIYTSSSITTWCGSPINPTRLTRISSNIILKCEFDSNLIIQNQFVTCGISNSRRKKVISLFLFLVSRRGKAPKQKILVWFLASILVMRSIMWK